MRYVSRATRINRRVRKARAEKINKEQSFNRQDGKLFANQVLFSAKCIP